MTAGFLQRERIVAKPGWTRWMVPPAALAVHLSVGAAYGWSVMKPGLETGLGLTGVQSALPFTVAFAMLGISAAIFGTKVDTNGPRWAMVMATSCFVSGWMISALGLYLRQYWMVILGWGFVGGIGLGIGYISPVSTLMKWFPDRPGLATGIAIMGFGGGALIISPIATLLLNTFGAGADRLEAAEEADTGGPGHGGGDGPSRPLRQRHGVDLPRVGPELPAGHDTRLVADPGTSGPHYAPARMGSEQGQDARRHDHHRARVEEQRDQDPPVLAPVDRAVLQRLRGYRHHRESRTDLHGLLR